MTETGTGIQPAGTKLLRVRFLHFDLGPYQGWDDEEEHPKAAAVSHALNLAHGKDPRFPLPYEDCVSAGTLHDLELVQHGQAWVDSSRENTLVPSEGHAWRCAFATRKKLEWWFGSNCRKRLEKGGFIVAEITLKDGAPVAHGIRQSIYRKSDVAAARRVEW